MGCGGKSQKATVQAPSTTVELSPEQELREVLDHYWDGFDFEDTEALKELNREQLVYAISEYVSLIPVEDADARMRDLIRRASTSHDMLDYFATICEIVLHNPNSPLRNDEYYIPVLEQILESPLLDEYDRIAPMYDLDMARKNRIGMAANDFVYTLRDGRKSRLYDIDAPYTILMFANPGCPMCREIMDEITASPLLNEMIEMGALKVLSVYPDEDIVAWRDYLAQMPAKWINAYDDGMVIASESLYNLNAIPSLYLLDAQKRVLVKDGVSVPQIEDVISIIESQK